MALLSNRILYKAVSSLDTSSYREPSQGVPCSAPFFIPPLSVSHLGSEGQNLCSEGENTVVFQCLTQLFAQYLGAEQIFIECQNWFIY